MSYGAESLSDIALDERPSRPNFDEGDRVICRGRDGELERGVVESINYPLIRICTASQWMALYKCLDDGSAVELGGCGEKLEHDTTEER